jgi:hypothetical protein
MFLTVMYDIRATYCFFRFFYLSSTDFRDSASITRLGESSFATDVDEIKSSFVSYVQVQENMPQVSITLKKLKGIRPGALAQHLKNVTIDTDRDLKNSLEKSRDQQSDFLQNLSFIGDEDKFDPEEDIIIIPDNYDLETSFSAKAYTAYKTVDKKIKPVSGTFPESARVYRQFPHNPLEGLVPLSQNPPPFIPNNYMTQERMDSLDLNKTGFLWPEEKKLFEQAMLNNQYALAFEEVDRGTFSDSYFTPYIIPTVPHIPWEYKNIPIPPGIKDKVIELLKHKMSAGVYEFSQSAYRSRWFCVLKKSGKLRIVHDLQPLNAITIRDAGLPPILDDFVEPFAGRQCYTVFDLFWGFDARKVDPSSRDLTAFLTPLGLLRITSMPTGFTNSPAEFQRCMLFILQDEIPDTANIFIDDLPIKGPAIQYLTKDGEPETLEENPGIRRFIWEHAVDVN